MKILTRKTLYIAAVFYLTACAPPREAALRYLLPPPPETARLEWLATYSSDKDFPKTEAERNLEKLSGKKANRLAAPSGIASDGEGKVFVGDIQNNNIMVFDLKARKADFLLASGDVEPRQMTFDSRKNLYVADSAHHCIKVFSRDGQLLQSYGSPDDLKKPLGVAIDEKQKRLYVSDGAAHLVKIFDLESGKIVSSLGSGTATRKGGDIYNPAGLALAADGSLCVVEHLNARLSLFNPDGSFRKYFGLRNASDAGFENPRGAAFDSEGNLWVVDFRRNSLRAYDLDGQLLFKQEGPAENKMGFSTPSAIHIDANDEIFVADFTAGRFSHWRYLSKKALASHPITKEDLERINAALATTEEEDITPASPSVTTSPSK